MDLVELSMMLSVKSPSELFLKLNVEAFIAGIRRSECMKLASATGFVHDDSRDIKVSSRFSVTMNVFRSAPRYGHS